MPYGRNTYLQQRIEELNNFGRQQPFNGVQMSSQNLSGPQTAGVMQQQAPQRIAPLSPPLSDQAPAVASQDSGAPNTEGSDGFFSKGYWEERMQNPLFMIGINMLANPDPGKGLSDGLAALNQYKEQLAKQQEADARQEQQAWDNSFKTDEFGYRKEKDVRDHDRGIYEFDAGLDMRKSELTETRADRDERLRMQQASLNESRRHNLFQEARVVENDQIEAVKRNAEHAATFKQQLMAQYPNAPMSEINAAVATQYPPMITESMVPTAELLNATSKQSNQAAQYLPGHPLHNVPKIGQERSINDLTPREVEDSKALFDDPEKRNQKFTELQVAVDDLNMITDAKTLGNEVATGVVVGSSPAMYARRVFGDDNAELMQQKLSYIAITEKAKMAEGASKLFDSEKEREDYMKSVANMQLNDSVVQKVLTRYEDQQRDKIQNMGRDYDLGIKGGYYDPQRYADPRTRIGQSEIQKAYRANKEKMDQEGSRADRIKQERAKRMQSLSTEELRRMQEQQRGIGAARGNTRY